MVLAAGAAAQDCETAQTAQECGALDAGPDTDRCAWCEPAAEGVTAGCVSCSNVAMLEDPNYKCESYFPSFPCGANRDKSQDTPQPPSPTDPAERACETVSSEVDCAELDAMAAKAGAPGDKHCTFCVNDMIDQKSCVSCRQFGEMEAGGFKCRPFSGSVCVSASEDRQDSAAPAEDGSRGDSAAPPTEEAAAAPGEDAGAPPTAEAPPADGEGAPAEEEGTGKAGGESWVACGEAETTEQCAAKDESGFTRIREKGWTGDKAAMQRCTWCHSPKSGEDACVPCSEAEKRLDAGDECHGYGEGSCLPAKNDEVAGERMDKWPGAVVEQQDVLSPGQLTPQVDTRRQPNGGKGRVPNYQGPGQRPYKTPVAGVVPPDRPTVDRTSHGTVDQPKWACPVASLFVREEAAPGLRELGPDDLRREQTFTDDVAAHLGEYAGYRDLRNTLFPHVSTRMDLSQPEKVPFRDLTKHFFSCIDGRADYAVMGTPGGDAGEFLLALNVMERARRAHASRFAFEDVLFWLQQYLEDMQEAGRLHFYMGTDAAALRRWGSAAHAPNPLQPRGFEERERLIALAAEPQHVGNVFLRAALEHPEEFMVRRDLTEHFIKAYLTVYYDVNHPMRGRLLFVALNGTHNEQAIVNVDRSKGYPCGASAPLVVPRVRSRSFLVNHRAAADLYRAEFASWVAAKLNLPVRARCLGAETSGDVLSPERRPHRSSSSPAARAGPGNEHSQDHALHWAEAVRADAGRVHRGGRQDRRVPCLLYDRGRQRTRGRCAEERCGVGWRPGVQGNNQCSAVCALARLGVHLYPEGRLLEAGRRGALEQSVVRQHRGPLHVLAPQQRGHHQGAHHPQRHEAKHAVPLAVQLRLHQHEEDGAQGARRVEEAAHSGVARLAPQVQGVHPGDQGVGPHQAPRAAEQEERGCRHVHGDAARPQHEGGDVEEEEGGHHRARAEGGVQDVLGREGECVGRGAQGTKGRLPP